MKIKDVLKNKTYEFLNTGITSALLDARILMQHVLKCSFEQLLLIQDQNLTTQQLDAFNKLSSRRLEKEPIAYIINKKEFYGRNFHVNQNVLIPRNDSETLIDAVLELYGKRIEKPLRILELGVGSGCLIITLLLELKNAFGVGVEVSNDAIEVAKRNAIKHGVHNILNLNNIDWNDFFKQENSDTRFDLIISNPPYIKSDYDLDDEVRMYEPHEALFSENNGLNSYLEIASFVPKIMSEDATLFLEIGQNMQDDVINICTDHNLSLERSYKDIAGITRCLAFKKS